LSDRDGSCSPNGAAAIFLDRDGVLNEPVVQDGKPYSPATLEQFRIYPEALDSLNRLKRAGVLLVVVTNQPEVGRGTLSACTVDAMHARLLSSLPLDRIEVCYDDGVDVDSEFRKPKPGMILAAAAALGIDVGLSFLVGDRWRDIDAGARAGCRTVFIDRGWRESLRTTPDFACASLTDATNFILMSSGRQTSGRQ
jgi:D-glycero-D-manno-heptose 1,7-bisphosphate phosphatase